MKPSHITRELKKHGLAGLHESGLLPQIAFILLGKSEEQTHANVRKLLSTVEPGKREQCYNAMRPHFTSMRLKPLDVYIAEAGREAEAKQLPVFDNKTGEVHDHDWVDPTRAISKAISEATAEHSMKLCCVKCTVVEEFKAWLPTVALAQAEKLGWVRRGDGNWICPKCPAIRLA
jgi:hypothetical protein